MSWISLLKRKKKTLSGSLCLWSLWTTAQKEAFPMSGTLAGLTDRGKATE
jgi:hypothetical protein